MSSSLVTSLTSLSYAGASHVDCLNPIAYADADVNVVFLPFDRAADSTGKKTGYFAELPLLMQLDTLLHLLPYRSVGAVQLDPPMSPTSDCNAKEVTRRLFDRHEIKPNHGLVVVSGLLYQEGEDYYVKTSATFQRRGATEQISFPIGGMVLFGNPGTQTVSFQPRHLTRKQLQKLEDAYDKANVVRLEPSLNSSGTRLPSPFDNCSGGTCNSGNPRYYVIEQRDNWFRTQWFAPGSRGRQYVDD